ncbi:MAG: hypothetical protein FWD72_04780, partial [Eggerthellaceae bacterium]|nr:hypothetical protein [Eggerthellaceae bacterium]
MTLFEHNEANSLRSRLQVEALLGALGEAADAAVLFEPTARQVAGRRKLWAGKDFLFGLAVTTFRAWAADRWALFGDGRAIVTPLQRKLMLLDVASTLRSQGKVAHLAPSTGTVEL